MYKVNRHIQLLEKQRMVYSSLQLFNDIPSSFGNLEKEIKDSWNSLTDDERKAVTEKIFKKG